MANPQAGKLSDLVEGFQRMRLVEVAAHNLNAHAPCLACLVWLANQRNDPILALDQMRNALPCIAKSHNQYCFRITHRA